MLDAALMAVTGMATRVPGNGHEPVRMTRVAYVVLQRPRPIQGRRAEIIRIPCNHIAGGMADAAVDTLNPGIRGAPGG